MLDNPSGRHKNTQHFGPRRQCFPAPTRMLQSQSSNSPLSKPMDKCQHPRVQIVARDEDSEFVECLECREVFEASEFKDMAIEAEPEDEE